MVDEVLSALGQMFVAGGGGAAVAFFLFRFLGQSWMETKFQKNLESFRNEKAKDYERFRSELDDLSK